MYLCRVAGSHFLLKVADQARLVYLLGPVLILQAELQQRERIDPTAPKERESFVYLCRVGGSIFLLKVADQAQLVYLSGPVLILQAELQQSPLPPQQSTGRILRECANPQGRVAAKRTLALARQVYMRGNLLRVQSRVEGSVRGGGERRFA